MARLSQEAVVTPRNYNLHTWLDGQLPFALAKPIALSDPEAKIGDAHHTECKTKRLAVKVQKSI